jgi:hypothetical protein
MGDEPCEELKNSVPKVRVRSSGGKVRLLKNSRVWSSAMMTMTNPRKRSTEITRGAKDVPSVGSALIVADGLDAITDHHPRKQRVSR